MTNISTRVQRAVLSLCLLATFTACGKPISIKVNSPGGGSAESGASAESANRWLQSSVTFSWSPPLENGDGSTLHNLAGYRIYSGPSEQELDVRVTLTNPGVTVYTLDNLENDDICFAISAVNSKGIESPRSGVVYRPES